MIKIIKKGTRDVRECESCGCLFSFDRKDTESVFKNGRMDYKCVKCPQCSYKVILKQEETITVDQEKTLYEQGLPSCWTCDYYDKDLGICNVVIGKDIGLAENTYCTNYKEMKPCKDCDSDEASCCGCEKYFEWGGKEKAINEMYGSRLSI